MPLPGAAGAEDEDGAAEEEEVDEDDDATGATEVVDVDDDATGATEVVDELLEDVGAGGGAWVLELEVVGTCAATRGETGAIVDCEVALEAAISVEVVMGFPYWSTTTTTSGPVTVTTSTT